MRRALPVAQAFPQDVRALAEPGAVLAPGPSLPDALEAVAVCVRRAASQADSEERHGRRVQVELSAPLDEREAAAAYGRPGVPLDALALAVLPADSEEHHVRPADPLGVPLDALAWAALPVDSEAPHATPAGPLGVPLDALAWAALPVDSEAPHVPPADPPGVPLDASAPHRVVRVAPPG